MKIRFGALALVAALAACSGQDQTMTGDPQEGGHASVARSGVGPAIAGYSKDSQRTLGNAPDRGELFTYQKGAAVLHKGAYTLSPIALSEEHAIRGVATGMMTIPAPDGSEIKIRYQRHEESPDGNWSWIGRVVGGDQGQEAIITFGEHAVFGSIPQANGPSLQLTTERGIAYLVQADAARLFRGTRAGGDAKVPAAYGASTVHGTESLVASAMQKIQAQALAVSPKAVPAANTVDLVAGYSNGLATRLGSASAAVTKLTNLVAAANAALANSNVNGKIRLVSALQVSYADNTDNGTALDELTGNNGTGPITVPASLAPLRAARETYGADLVTLVRDFKSENNGCGIAWLLGANQQPITTAGDAPFAYSVVSEGSYQNGTSTLYCEDITLAHELAHNMGSAHDLSNAPDPGRYPYSYGYKTTAALGNFFTVMAYGDDGQTLYRVFSNPLITTCGGLACGVADQADNARSLTQTIPVVATFRSTIVPIAGSARNDINGDGKSELIFRHTALGQVAWWEMNGAAVTARRQQAAGSTYTLPVTGDFNGDGKTDLVWKSQANTLLIYFANSAGTAFTVTPIAGSYAAGWVLTAAGDVNGDGKSDLIFRNASSGLVAWWEMNGAVVTTRRQQVAGSTYSLDAVGDFNGDGKADLVWRSPANSLVIYLANSTGTAFTPTSVLGTFASGWTLAMANDVTGDGRSDLIFRNASLGQVSWWEMNGATVTTRRSQAAGSSYTLAATGDYNGDGRADLVWTNSQNWVVLYLSNTNGTNFTASTVAGTYGAGWTLQNGGK